MGTNGNGHHDKTVVVLQLSGGNDALNTVIPYNDGQYYDNRPFVNIPQDKVLKLDDKLGLNPALAPIKALWDEGKVALINGVGYPNPNRSHFRSMDVWHTAESEEVGEDGWLGRAIRELDPQAENVLTGVNFGRGLPRALYAKGVPVASVGNLETYGLFPDIKDEAARNLALEAFTQMYGGSGRDVIANFISQTGTDALKGADILRVAPRAVLLQRRVRRQPHRRQHEVHRAGDDGRPRHARLLHAARQLRHPRIRADQPCQALGGCVRRGRRLHGRHEGARHGQGCRGAALLRVRQAHQGQRRWHRPRLRRRRLRDWRRCQRRHVRRLPRRSTTTSSWKATCTSATTSAAHTPPSPSAGWASTPS